MEFRDLESKLREWQDNAERIEQHKDTRADKREYYKGCKDTYKRVIEYINIKNHYGHREVKE